MPVVFSQPLAGVYELISCDGPRNNGDAFHTAGAQMSSLPSYCFLLDLANTLFRDTLSDRDFKVKCAEVTDSKLYFFFF